MKLLSDAEIKDVITRVDNTFQENKEITEIMYKCKKHGLSRVTRDLESVEDYTKCYKDSWYTFKDWDELVESEREQGAYGLSEEELQKEIDVTIFQLSTGKWVQNMA